MRLRLIPPLLLLLLVLTGCPPFEMVSWSPNGRYLAFIGPDDERLWIWDTETGEPIEKKWEIDTDIAGLQFTTNDEMVLFRKREGSSDDHELFFRSLRKETWRQLLPDADIMKYTISGDGRYLLYVDELDDSEPKEGGTSEAPEGAKPAEETPAARYGLFEIDLRKRKPPRLLFKQEHDLAYPDVDPEGQRVLFVSEDKVQFGLHSFDRATGEVRRLADLPECAWPKWVNDHTLIYIMTKDEQRESPGDEEIIGPLVLHDLSDGSTKRLCEYVHIFDPPSLDEDRTKVVVMASTVDLANSEDPEEEVERLSTWQVALVDLETLEHRFVTDEPFGAGRAALDPAGARIAYITPPIEEGPGVTVRILDLETNRTTVVWRNEEERLLGEGIRLEQDGEPEAALEVWQALGDRSTESEELAFLGRFHTAMSYLRPPLLDIDKAFAIMPNLETDVLLAGERERRLFYPNETHVASDPGGDLIRTYGTEASAEEFKFETDATRDLVGLWARWSPERLHLRIDYASPRDLEGITFQDTVLLFDCGSPDQGLRTIAPGARWDRGAERLVRIRHWFARGRKSQYDVEILDADGEIVSRYIGSGFDPPGYPHFIVYDASGDWGEAPGALTCSLSRDALGLEDGQNVGVQVCTFKGGIESHKKLERPREEPSEGQPFCDVADAFGDANTAERIDADLESQSGPAVIKGVAATLEPTPPEPPEMSEKPEAEEQP